MNALQENLNDGKGIEAIRDALNAASFLIKLGMLALVFGFCFSGITNLEQFEKGIILRFGALHGEVKEEPGLVFALPYPIDEIVRIPAKRTQTIRSSTFWYALTDAEKKTGVNDTIPKSLKPDVDGFLLTGDRNILHARYTLKFRIRDPLTYAFSAEDIDTMIKNVLDNALLKEMAMVTADEALKNVSGLSKKVLQVFTHQMEILQFGIESDPLELQLSWPRQLKSLINEVLTTNQKAQQEVSAADVYARNQADQADSHGAKIRSTSKIWSTRKISRAKADAQTFKKLYPIYKKNPEVIQQTLYQDRMRKIMANVEEIFIIEQSKNREIRINLNRKGKSPKDNGNQ